MSACLRYKFSVFLVRAFRLAVVFVGSSYAVSPFSAAEGQVDAQTRVVMNRAVLTVGGDVFTAADAVALLMMWNLTKQENEPAINLTTDWLKPVQLPASNGSETIVQIKSWPADVKTFFEIALVWIDVQKLNLFVLREQELLAGFKKFSQLGAASFPLPIANLAGEVLSASEAVKKKWVESVLRARAFIRVRGLPERNKNLFSVGWYWHQTTPDKNTLK
ncbi:MAG: hypothetical protein RLZZ488_1371 [Pseudomonadota bacterium]|jgi:hypothetical protein